MKNYYQVYDKLVIAKDRLAKLHQKHAVICSQITKCESDLRQHEIAQTYIQEAARLTLESLSIKINTIVTNALEFIFGSTYKFDISFNIKYSKVVCSLILLKDNKPYDLRTQQGDGIVDIVALTLRIAVLCLDKRHLRRILILDEPAGAVSKAFQPKVGQLLEQLSDKLGIQIILVAAHGVDYQFNHAKCFNSVAF